ncbi:LysR family transcriptional regulator [Baekduia soli]|nr:LysR family transcriptional regulator [Baekduia soli]
MAAAARTPDLTELRSLVEAADSGTLGRAALRLHISQSALTKRLQGLEQLVGTELLERSQRGVALTPAGRRLYEHARPLLAGAAALDAVVAQLRRESAPVRLAASHSAIEAFVAAALQAADASQGGLSVELVAANSMVVRSMVAERRADLGVCASRPGATPNPGLKEVPLAADEVVCAVPRGHPWAARGTISRAEFLRTPVVARDPSSNARWTVEHALRRAGLAMPEILAEAPTPAIARQRALSLNVPVLLSRHVLGEFLVPLEVTGLRFVRTFELVMAADLGPDAAARMLIGLLEAAAERSGHDRSGSMDGVDDPASTA